MTRKKMAIRLLTEQKEKLSSLVEESEQVWISTTAAIIREYFGPQSEQFAHIKNFKFLTGIIYEDERKQKFSKRLPVAAAFIDECIKSIRESGVARKEKRNFLNQLDNATLIAILLPAAGLIGTVCFEWGKYISDVQNISLKNMIDRQADSISLLNRRLYDSNTVPTVPDTTLTTHDSIPVVVTHEK